MQPARPARIARLTLALVLGLALAACDSGGDIPTADELDGIWVNVDGTTVRAFEFVATTRTYTLDLYETGSSPVTNQTGTYSIDGSRLITSVDASVDASIVGQAFANDILAYTGRTLTLSSKSAASGKRVFTKSATFP